MEAVSVEDLKKDITAQDYLTLTFGDDTNASRALDKARLWTRGKVLSTGATADEDNEVVRSIILIRAVYELFSFVGYSDRAKAKEADAIDLLEAYFGTVKAKGDRDASASAAGPAGGAITVSKIPRYGG
jgi:hypothetical protein